METPENGELFAVTLQPPAEHHCRAVCVECGTSFPGSAGAGRPRKFCSEACRARRGKMQRREWSNTHAGLDREIVTCRECGAVVPIGDRPAGRLPRFCSNACRRLAMHPTLRPNNTAGDLFAIQPERKDQ